ncbi:hypothetical protein ACQKMI_03260 [Lysinibacillus sp. NPDC097214]|uniref:hypothetical protein n=1 Tax=Lysinibacillus sp. NPDC097214 TaxID=3390584 RepID=UPI003D062F83
MGQQMTFARKRSANAAAATCFVCAKAKRQQHGFNCAKAKRQQQQHNVGHSVFATGRGVLRLSSSISVLFGKGTISTFVTTLAEMEFSTE